ncbi:MAG: hypothetical protein IPL39_02990 [Opitutaceae bacterium]|nr:hypothetical protein [Opitutaceae bacterium]
MRNARVLANGGDLVAHYGLGVVREYEALGKVVREIPAPGGAHSALRLPDGNTLIAIADGDRNPQVIGDSAGRDDLAAHAGGCARPEACLHDRPAAVGQRQHGHDELACRPWSARPGAACDRGDAREARGVALCRPRRVQDDLGIVLLDEPGDCTKGEILH